MEPAELERVLRETSYTGWRRQEGSPPLIVRRAEGCRFYDAEGRSYLDFASQLAATNLGHGNAAVIAGIAEQAAKLQYVQPGFGTEVRGELQRELTRVLPSGLVRFFWSTSGTEAVEAALKLARVATGKPKILARTRSYHGSTAGAISVSGDLRRTPLEGLHLVPGTVWAPDCYCYRCPLGLRYPSCAVACAEEVEKELAGRDDVAAMILEPVVGTNGVIPPVAEYLPRIREITRRRGVLLIVDEVMTGWGRTGTWFASERYGILPDILVTAKGITGGYAPLGLTATTQAVFEAFRERYLPLGHTYEGHPLLLAPALAAIGEYRRLDLIEKSRRDGEFLLEELRGVAQHHRSVGEVRGVGLFAAVELVRDRAAKEPMNTPEEKLAGKPLVVDEVAKAMLAEGVYVMSWISHLVLAPPLTISREEISEAMRALDKALTIADRSAAPDGQRRG
ncbi:MAG: aspartate aminotransferase family protein [Thermoplasmata archaeon]|nr:aspartate aminotransferase family protein [Thermoplasmata archaeon]